ncbi:MAG TPA: GNAT family N-acetyltransferase [Bryobacteraceae bacterium]|jgi:RimJ/RimL family protein N-acetyltransferase|nr:GNAT family N-acetyltransferase [Bryobacteraceae bacterium]
MDRVIVINSPEISGIALVSIGLNDIENLRIWKNNQRQVFFFQEEIQPEDQIRWFAAYQNRPSDYMFMVHWQTRAVGCLGFRILTEEVDIYNVILADQTLRNQGIMSGALQLLVAYGSTLSRLPVSVRVLRSNPAVAWYRRNHFLDIAATDTYYKLQLDRVAFPAVRIGTNGRYT